MIKTFTIQKRFRFEAERQIIYFIIKQVSFFILCLSSPYGVLKTKNV